MEGSPPKSDDNVRCFNRAFAAPALSLPVALADEDVAVTSVTSVLCTAAAVVGKASLLGFALVARFFVAELVPLVLVLASLFALLFFVGVFVGVEQPLASKEALASLTFFALPDVLGAEATGCWFWFRGNGVSGCSAYGRM